MPERLARRVAQAAGLAVVEPPFGDVELVEALWWHPDRAAGDDHHWLRRILVDVAAGLDDAADGAPWPRPALAAEPLASVLRG